MLVTNLVLQANEQIKQQSVKSSSIILALTDGKLAVYVHELTVKQVIFILTTALNVAYLPPSLAFLPQRSLKLNSAFFLIQKIKPFFFLTYSFAQVSVHLFICTLFHDVFSFSFFKFQPVAHHPRIYLNCRLTKRGNMALVFTVWVSKTLMSSR